ncbi:hypothetical protein PGTUg99_006859 [Puccinia graminis f. sp. tritici]|uniref:Uncharacterized protein n=1 Tax=Puccinia graminis f. sp. tritici TaxID=56615 RepID=A0A5B0RRN5_PUCGR|nr:hypothetical protein PGTUg99_006859 [Puccinia graminis f. sp. tritici]
MCAISLEFRQRTCSVSMPGIFATELLNASSSCPSHLLMYPKGPRVIKRHPTSTKLVVEYTSKDPIRGSNPLQCTIFS